MSRVILIIPAYNEADNILTTVDSVQAAGLDYVVVNDGSTDDTRLICQKNQLNFVDLSSNLGIGGAVQTTQNQNQLSAPRKPDLRLKKSRL